MSGTALLIAAAGSSSRLGLGSKKEYLLLDGQSLLSRSLRPFLGIPLSAVAIAHPPGGEAQALAAIAPDLLEALGTRLILCPGADSRRRSVLCGLRRLSALSPSHVLIHDGARPFASPGLIERVWRGALASGAAVPLIAAVDSVKTLGADGWIAGHPPRRGMALAQTPQAFEFPGILRAHEEAERDLAAGQPDEYTDDAAIYAAYVGRVSSVAGERENRKITFKEDI